MVSPGRGRCRLQPAARLALGSVHGATRAAVACRRQLGKSITSFTAPLPEPWRNTQATHTTRHDNTRTRRTGTGVHLYRDSRARSDSVASTRWISSRTLMHSEGYIGCFEYTAPELGASRAGMQRHWRSHQHACRR